MTKDQALSSCCSSRIALEPLVYLPTHTTFARVPRCSCGKFKGPVSIMYTAPKGIAAKWTGSSEAAMIEQYGTSPRPLWFVDGGTWLKPVGYAGEVRQQAELAEEPPF